MDTGNIQWDIDGNGGDFIMQAQKTKIEDPWLPQSLEVTIP